jgi:hypothetical protein
LTPAKIDKLIAAAKRGRYGQRDATLILVAYRQPPCDRASLQR